MGPRAPDWSYLKDLDPSSLEEEEAEKVKFGFLDINELICNR